MKKNTLLQALDRFNHLKIFNTALWPHKEIIVKLIACILIILYFIYRFPLNRFQVFLLLNELSIDGSVHPDFNYIHLNVFLRLGIICLENLILITYIIAFVFRIHAKNNANTFLETLYPFVVAYLPLLISIIPYNESFGFRNIYSSILPSFIFMIMVFGYLINLTSLITLRRSFAVMIETRELVQKGIYGFIRHPAYGAHFIIFFGVLMLHFSFGSLVVYIVFIMGQYFRAKIEESKLVEAFPDYRTYKEHTGMFIPKLKLKL